MGRRRLGDRRAVDGVQLRRRRNRSPGTANRISAETVMAGWARPSASREALAESLVGDQAPAAKLRAADRAAAEGSHSNAERNWAVGRLEPFRADGNRLGDRDATRMLVAWEDISRESATEHNAPLDRPDPPRPRRGPYARGHPARVLQLARRQRREGLVRA